MAAPTARLASTNIIVLTALRGRNLVFGMTQIVPSDAPSWVTSMTAESVIGFMGFPLSLGGGS
jgi:hypothetical protein